MVSTAASWHQGLGKTVATRAGQRLGILQQVTHLLTPQSLSTIYKAQVRSVMEYSPFAWVGVAPTTLKKLDTIQDKATHLIGTTSTNIQSLHHRRSVAAVCNIYKMHCSNSPKILRQHLPNPQPLPSRRTRGSGYMGTPPPASSPPSHSPS